MRTVARWQAWHGGGLEHCMFQVDHSGVTLEGAVVGARQGLYGGHYVVRADTDFNTRRVEVVYVGGQQLHIVSDGSGNWRDALRDKALPDLDGCIDVDIGITPATNMLPIKRLALQPDESKRITVAYIPLPDQIEADFVPVRAEQRYTCLIPDRRYRYEGLFRGFTAELEVDDAGLVLNYPETFRRISASS